MPQRISWPARLARAEEYLYLARAVALPADGHERGSAVRHKQSLLKLGRAYVLRLAGPRPPRGATGGEIRRARWLVEQLDAEEPELLEDIRRRAHERQ